jgi:hypothetical protein
VQCIKIVTPSHIQHQEQRDHLLTVTSHSKAPTLLLLRPLGSLTYQRSNNNCTKTPSALYTVKEESRSFDIHIRIKKIAFNKYVFILNAHQINNLLLQNPHSKTQDPGNCHPNDEFQIEAKEVTCI